MKKLRELLSGEGLKARALRGSALSVLNFGGSNALRLASNLILTRLLFPEAFGLMALVQVFITGLRMFSDTGIRTQIIQSPRGDDPVFLNTAWTLQIVRGFALWLGACAMALPAAALYDEPMLTQLLPAVGFNMVLSGFTTTNLVTANRHLLLGRVTVIGLITQVLELALTMALAFWLKSVWALVIGGLISTAITTLIMHRYIPGIRNRLCWDRQTLGELFSFGQFIFLSTAVTFLISQGDKAILGAWVPLAALGVYNIGYFLGSLPQMFHSTINGKIVFPLYRLKPISGGPKNRAKIFKARRLVLACTIALTAGMAYGGIFLVDLMYDPRYALAGPVVVLLSTAMVPRLSINTYGAVLLAMGEARQYFILNASTAFLQTALMFIGVIWFGMFGVIVAPAIALLLTNPLRIHYIRKHDAWDWKADAFFMTLGLTLNGFACWLHWDEIIKLMN